MFHHVKELQFNARVSGPDPTFARLLLEQFGGGNGELKAAMQYFIQAFGARRPYPEQYDLLMDIATEELGHLEIVGATITMLLDGINGELKDAADQSVLRDLSDGGTGRKEQYIHEALMNPQFLVLTGGGPQLTDSNGYPWSGSFVNANGDLTVDHRSNIAAESRAKIVYEYLIQFTDDPYVKETLGFLMTREITHMQQFTAALAQIEPNFPPGILQGDPRYLHTAFNMSNGASARGPWNSGTGPWEDGGSWNYVDNPVEHVIQTHGLIDQPVDGSGMAPEELAKLEQEVAQMRTDEINRAASEGGTQWSAYPQQTLEAPPSLQDS